MNYKALKVIPAGLSAGVLLWVGRSHAAPVSGQGTWQTTLQDRDLDGNGTTDAFYDTALNITWLRNANAGAGSSFDDGKSSTDGKMTWVNAVDWAAALSFGGYDDWRLPNG